MHRAPQEIRTYFVTAVCAQRRRLFQVTANAELMVATLLHYRAERRYRLHAFIIMPDHLHLCLTPAEDVSLERAMQLIKGGFSFRLGSKQDVWMRSFNEVQLRTPDKFVACRAYIENNPVRKGMCKHPADYPFSSAISSEVDPAPPLLRG